METPTTQTTSQPTTSPQFSKEELAKYAELFGETVLNLFIFYVALDMKRLGFTDLQRYVGYVLLQHYLNKLGRKLKDTRTISGQA